MKDKERNKYIAVYDGRRFEDAYPGVKTVRIAYSLRYPNAFFPPLSDSGILEKRSGSDCTFAIKCLNDDCTRGYFNLYSIVVSMIAHKETDSKGTLRCEGNEADDHNYRCPCVLEYEISIEYIDN